MTESTLFYGGEIVTVDPNHPDPEAVLAVGERIECVGDLQTARRLAPDDTQEVDLRNGVLLPGLIDAHSHPLWAAKTRGAPVVDVRAETVPTFDAVLAKIERRVAAAKPGEHLLFFGLDAQLHEGFQTMSREMLDALAPDTPLGVQTSKLPRALHELCRV